MKKQKYTILPEPLHLVADQAIKYFVKRRGVPSASIQVETPIRTDVPYRPTFTCETSDNYTVCVEVSESPYTNALDDFVLTCRDLGLPVKLFISIPKDIKDPDYSQKLKKAKSRGVGVLEVDEHSSFVIQDAMALSLAGVRPIDIESFPAKLRENLTRAESMFRNGSPEKACAAVYDEIESICRVLGKKTYDSGYWKQTVKFKFETESWANLMQLTAEHLDTKKAKCPALSPAFISRIHGVTPHRNESGHKPKDFDALVKRDRELRTRFENACDLLLDLVNAVKPLRIV